MRLNYAVSEGVTELESIMNCEAINHRSLLILTCLIYFSSLAVARAATINAASCNTSDVQNAINSAAAGDTVMVPAGTCSWSGLSISGISNGQYYYDYTWTGHKASGVYFAVIHHGKAADGTIIRARVRFAVVN